MSLKNGKEKSRRRGRKQEGRSTNDLDRHPGLYRAQLSCKIGRDALEGKTTPPDGILPIEWALFSLLHAVEDIAKAMMPDN